MMLMDRKRDAESASHSLRFAERKEQVAEATAQLKAWVAGGSTITMDISYPASQLVIGGVLRQATGRRAAFAFESHNREFALWIVPGDYSEIQTGTAAGKLAVRLSRQKVTLSLAGPSPDSLFNVPGASELPRSAHHSL
jgi:hypothetical protein